MGTHPVFLCLVGRRCVVLGGDEAAAAKARACHDAGGVVTLIAETLASEGRPPAAGGGFVHERRAYRRGDLAGAFLCYASLADPATLAAVRAEAEREGVLLNVVDRPEACDFFAAAVVRRGPLQIAVGTGGTSPAAAAHVRRRVETLIGPEYGTMTEILGQVRRAIASRPDRHDVLRALADSPLAELLRQDDLGAVDRLLVRVAGEGCTLERLGIAPAAGA
jgi:siroheme synthase-like protein